MSDWRNVSRLEAALLIVVMVAAIGAWFLFQERSSARQDVEDAQDRVARTRKAIESLTEEEVSLRADVEGLEPIAPAIEVPAFPSRSDALQLSARVAGYVAERGMRVSSFDSGQTAVPVSELQFPAIGYSISAKGSADSLIGLLVLIDEVRTGVIQTLEVSRDPDTLQQWFLSLNLVVVYDG